MPSIRLLTELVKAPVLVAYCDSACPTWTARECAPDVSIKDNLAQFVAEAERTGWLIGLLGCICPAHAKQIRDAQLLAAVPASALPC
jgi:hypothetical protein